MFNRLLFLHVGQNFQSILHEYLHFYIIKIQVMRGLVPCGLHQKRWRSNRFFDLICKNIQLMSCLISRDKYSTMSVLTN